MYVLGVHRCQKRAWNPLDVELLLIVSLYVGAEN